MVLMVWEGLVGAGPLGPVKQNMLSQPQYDNIRTLLQQMPMPPAGSPALQVSKELQQRLRRGFALNDDFAIPLNQELADPNLRAKIIGLAKEDPVTLLQIVEGVKEPGQIRPAMAQIASIYQEWHPPLAAGVSQMPPEETPPQSVTLPAPPAQEETPPQQQTLAAPSAAQALKNMGPLGMIIAFVGALVTGKWDMLGDMLGGMFNKPGGNPTQETQQAQVPPASDNPPQQEQGQQQGKGQQQGPAPTAQELAAQARITVGSTTVTMTDHPPGAPTVPLVVPSLGGPPTRAVMP